MPVIHTVTLRNFLSVGAITQTVKLNVAPLTLLLGSNGDGKSTLLQAICYVLYGEPLTKIKVDNLVNSINQKDMYVTLDFISDNIEYRIERGRKPNTLRFLVGAERVDVSKGSNDKTQLEIDRVIGMSHMLFLHVVALNTFTLPFLKMRPAEQREVIEELMGITQLSLYAEHLKEVADATKAALRDEEAMIRATTDANARITTVIEKTKQQADRWNVDQDNLLTELGDRAAKMLEIDIEAELKLFDQIDAWQNVQAQRDAEIAVSTAQIASLTKSIEQAKQRLALFETEANATETDEIKCLRQQITRLQAEANQDDTAQRDRWLAQAQRHRAVATAGRKRCQLLLTEIETTVQELADPDAHRCSTCGQDLAGTDHLASVIHNLDAKRKSLIVEYERLDIEANLSDKDAQAVDREIGALADRRQVSARQIAQQIADIEREIVTTHAASQQRRLDAERNAQAVRYEIAEQRNSVQGHQDNIQRVTVYAETFGSRPIANYPSRDALFALRQDRDKLFGQLDVELNRGNPFQEKIDGLTSSLLTINYDKLNTLIVQQKHEQFLYKLLTSKDSFIRKRVIDQNLSFLNRCLNRYLERLGLPHEVRFLPDLTVDITLAGRDFDFEQLSRGEMNRLILATSWSFRDLWESLNTTLNLMFCDEVLDQGTDEAGVEAAVDVLMQIARERHKNIILISHRENLRTRIERVLIARKEDSFTSFADETI